MADAPRRRGGATSSRPESDTGRPVGAAQRFSRAQRILRRAEYDRIFRQGRRRASASFVCHILVRPGEGCKLGLAVSRKVGSAVIRNRVKRYIRETYRKVRGRLTGDTHVVIVARPGAAALTYQQAEAELIGLWRHMGVLDARGPADD